MVSSTAETEQVTGATRQSHRRRGPHDIRLGFRRWRRSRAFWGGVWSVLGGLIILAMPAMSIRLLIASGTTVLVGILTGLLIVIFGLFLWFAPSLRQITGVLIVLLAVASLVTADLGGFLVGMLLAMVGGALGFAWVPTEPRLKRWRSRRLLHLSIPAVQPDLELHGIAQPSAVPLDVAAPNGMTVAPSWTGDGSAPRPEVVAGADSSAPVPEVVAGADRAETSAAAEAREAATEDTDQVDGAAHQPELPPTEESAAGGTSEERRGTPVPT